MFPVAIVWLIFSVPVWASSTDAWNAAGGFGLTVGAPGGTQLLVSPQLEYASTPRVFMGPLIQAGISENSIFGVSGTVRYLAGDHAKVRPCFEAGIGFAVATGATAASPLGLLLHAGMGVDYLVGPNFAIGTVFRLNFAPPIADFFVSWPLIVIRTAL